MFGRRYWGARYYGVRYWGEGGGVTPPPAPTEVRGGGGFGKRKRKRARVVETPVQRAGLDQWSTTPLHFAPPKRLVPTPVVMAPAAPPLELPGPVVPIEVGPALDAALVTLTALAPVVEAPAPRPAVAAARDLFPFPGLDAAQARAVVREAEEAEDIDALLTALAVADLL